MRAPETWHEDAIRHAYSGGDKEWTGCLRMIIRASALTANSQTTKAAMLGTSCSRNSSHLNAAQATTGCATVVAGGAPMPAPAAARAKELPGKTISLDERIRRRAHELYVERGNQSGSELDDWLQAEEQIQQAQEEAIPHTGLERSEWAER